MGQVRKKPGDDDHYRKSDESWRAPVGGFRGHPTPASSAPSSDSSTSGDTYRSWETQSKTDDVHVKVNAGWDQDHDVAVTDIEIFDRDGSGSQHVVIDDMGNELFNERRHDK